MSKISKKLWKAAHTIRFDLVELVGNEKAQVIDAQLDKLLAQSQQGQDVEKQIRDLLTSHDQLKVWSENFYAEKHSKVKEFSGLPGKNTVPIPPEQYYCPTPGCSRLWFRRTVGQEVPPCPQHHCPLEPKK